jgi:drug/metabolite transporter (DMT)-like permease
VKQVVSQQIIARDSRPRHRLEIPDSHQSTHFHVTNPHQLKGILFMLSSTALFVLGDTFLKLASTDLPANQLTFLRAVVSALACAGTITVWRQWSGIVGLAHPRTALRGCVEAFAAVFFTLGLARLAIADAFAIAQTVPLFLLLGATLIYQDRLTGWQALLAIVGFGGALLVAQPGFDGVSSGMVFAFAAAICVACRDLVGRGIPNTIPVAVVAGASSVMIIVLAGGILLATQEWTQPSLLNLFYVALAGLCVAIGQSAVVVAYRNADTVTLAPLFYSFAIWSVLSGLLIWGDLPNTYATIGIALIVGSGLLLIWISDRGKPT